MINLRAECRIALSILFVLHIAHGDDSANARNTLASKEDLADIDIHDDLNENEVDKNKRELPKVQEAIINVLKPVPIVDTISEEEKYGNSGDKFNGFGRGVVTGVETLGKLINKVLDFPMEALKKLSRSTTETLNNLGGKLVGLQ